MLVTLRNVAIIALLALAVTVLPGGGNVVEAILTALSLVFFAAIAMLIARFWTESSLTRDSMTDRQRGILYASLGALAVILAGFDELLGSGVGTVALLVIAGTAGYLVFTTWREASSF